MRLVFMGSPEFAVASLDRLLRDGHVVNLVVTQPDRPAGRGRDLRPPPVKQAAERHNLLVLQPERLTDPMAQAALQGVKPEAVVVVAFGQFLPRSVRELPAKGCVNVHASLLPKYRGAAPINWALICGETETGISIMRIEAAMDGGPILLQRAIPVEAGDNAATLHDKLARLGADALAEALRLLEEGRATWTAQDESRATLAPKLRDEDCRLDLAGDAPSLVNRVRGLTPAPGAYVVLPDGHRLKVLLAEGRSGVGDLGAVLRIEESALVVGTGKGALALLGVQPEGKRRMTGAEFARGQRLSIGSRLT